MVVVFILYISILFGNNMFWMVDIFAAILSQRYHFVDNRLGLLGEFPNGFFVTP